MNNSYDFRQQAKGRFVVHVYKVSMKHNEYYFKDEILARSFCDTCFNQPDVYKVKLWDLAKGPIEPNRPYAKALVYELV